MDFKNVSIFGLVLILLADLTSANLNYDDEAALADTKNAIPLSSVVRVGREASADADADASDGDKVPAMYAAHDYASEIMHEKMTIANGKSCDSEFNSQIVGIVNDMEQNREASDVFAQKLRSQFDKLIEKKSSFEPEKKLCVKNHWCDSGTCKPIVTETSGRAMMPGGAKTRQAAVAEESTEAKNDTDMPDKKKNEKSFATSIRSGNLFGVAISFWILLHSL